MRTVSAAAITALTSVGVVINETRVPYIPPPVVVMPSVRTLPKCRRCGKRNVAREFDYCNVCKGRGRR